MKVISQKVGADALIEGSAALANDRVRVTVRLVHGASDRQLWSGTYERPLSNVLALQGDLAQAIADAVKVVVTADEKKRLSDRRPVDSEAYMSFLIGGHFFNRRGTDNIKKSVEYYRQAVVRDPTFADAYGRLALSQCLLIESVPPQDAYREVKAAAAQALALDPTQADALVALSQARFLGDRDWEGAKRELENVLQRYPNHTTAHIWYASVLTEVGPLDQALAERRRAMTLDPVANATLKSVGEVLLQMGRYGEAETVLRHTLELDPGYADGYGLLALTHLRMGRRDDAIAEVDQVARLAPNTPVTMAWLAHTYGMAGRRLEGERFLEALADRSRTQWVSPRYFAQAYAGLGEFDNAFAYLEKAYAEGTPALVRMKSDPMLLPLQGDPRFASLVRRLNLPWP